MLFVEMEFGLKLKFTHLANRLQNKAQPNRNKETELCQCSKKGYTHSIKQYWNTPRLKTMPHSQASSY
jgi:hypothetical protein